MARVARGDRAAYGQLVHRHALRFRQVAYRLLGDMDAAEDMVQDAFVRLWIWAERFNPGKAKFTTWFYRVVTNRCLDEKRKKHPAQLKETFDMIDDRQRIEGEIAEQEKRRLLMAGLAQLSNRQQLAITLTYMDEISNQEAADIMELKIKAFESLLLRARRKLKGLLKDHKSSLLDMHD